MFEPVIAPSASLLGLLQRGRGDGQLHALAADREEATAALQECVTHDPRADWQIENRSLYYARLYVELQVPLTGLEHHLTCVEDTLDPHEARTGLALSVLGHLAAYGRRDARCLLHDYAAHGSNWAWAVDELALHEDEQALLALAPAVLGRFPDGPDGDAALRAAVRAAYEPRPWQLWAVHHPRVAAAGGQSPFDLWQRQLARPAVTPGWSAADVLAWADQAEAGDPEAPARRAAAAARCLAAVARPDDDATLLGAARDGEVGARTAALRHLADRRHPAVPALIEAAAAHPDQRIVAAALSVLGRLRGADALARARRWADSATGGTDSVLGEAAVQLLAAAGDPADGPLVVAALRGWILAHGVTGAGLGTLVEGAGRLAMTAAVPALRHVYGEAGSSDLRGRAARALAATDPCFGEGAAVECLWDCEEATRELAARHVTTTGDARVLERLRRLAADPAEEAEVHAAVRVRLTSRE